MLDKSSELCYIAPRHMSIDIIINIVSASVGVLLGAFLCMGIGYLFHKKPATTEPKHLSTKDKTDFITKVLNSKKLKLNADDSKIGQPFDNIIIFGNKKMTVCFEWSEFKSGNGIQVFCSVNDKEGNRITEFIIDEEDAMPLLDGVIHDIGVYHKKKMDESMSLLHQSIIDREYGDLTKIQKISKSI